MSKKLIFISLFMSAIAAQAQLNVLSSGFVGVGTTTPSAKLNVVESNESTTQTNFTQAVSSAGLLIQTDYTDGAFTPGLFWHTSNSYPTKPKAGIYLKETGSGTSMYLGTSSSYSTGINNNVIITPTGTLQSVNGSAGAPTYSFANTINTGMFSSGTGVLNFSVAGSEGMRIYNTGDICIGTTNNNGKVTINQTSGTAGLRVIKTYAGISYNLVSQVSDNSCKALVVQNSGDKFGVWGDGRTEIGGVYANNYMLNVYGTTYCTSGVWTASDSQFKQNITAIDAPIEKLNQLNGKRYSYNVAAFPEKNFPHGYTYGVIAQEVQAILPELVQADSAGYLAVNYDGLIPVIIEAIKTQQKTIKEQANQIAALNDEIASCCSTSSTKSMALPESTTTNNVTGSKTAYLMQNIPNPFTAKTTIRYYIPEQTNNASLLIFDMQGKLIKTYPVNSRKEGSTEINGGEMQPGMYMYSLIIDGKEIDTKRMILTN